MEWGTITTLVAEVLFGGGLLAFVTIKDKKTAAILENMQKVIEELRDLVREYKEENRSLKDDIKQKDEAIRGKEDYIRELHRQTSSLHEKLDKANSRVAVFKILKCTKVDCGLRIPPFGSGAVDTIKQINEGTLGDEEVRHEKE